MSSNGDTRTGKAYGTEVIETEAHRVLEQGISQDIGKLMKNMGLTMKQAMDALEIPQSDRAMYKKLLEENQG